MYSVVLITGASSGIGKALAFQYAKQGYRIAALARREERLIGLQKEIEEKYSTQVLPLVADVTKETSVKEAVQKTLDIFGKIDVVIANAGSGVKGRVDTLASTDFQRQFDVNIMGVLHTVIACIDPLKKSKGKIALMGSICSYIALPTSAPYSMSKFALRAFADSLRHELKSHKISVTLICPGFIESEFRKVDNQGMYQKDTKEPVPSWLLGDVNKAAQSIYHAVDRRQKEKLVTLHAKLLYAIKTFSPALFDFMASFFPKLRYREKKEAILK